MSARFDELEVIQKVDGLDDEVVSLIAGESLRVLPGRREVFHATLVDASINVVVKCFLPHAKQTRDWQAEWDGLRRLHELGLPCPRPLAVCSNAQKEICVLMEALESMATLGDYLNKSSLEGALPVVEQLVQLLTAQHEAGVYQSDQHIDNWAVCGDQVFLLDAASYQFHNGPLSPKQRTEDLAAICAILPPGVQKALRRTMHANYCPDGTDGREQTMGAALDSALIDLQKTRMRRYFKKTLRDCTEFEAITNASFSGMSLKGADADLLSRFFYEAELLVAEGNRLKSGNTCTVTSFEHSGKSYIIKRYNKKPFLTQLRRSLRPSRASISWSSAWVLDLAYIPSAKALAFYDERSFPRGRSYLLMEAIPGELLPAYVEKVSEDKEKLAALVENIGQIWDSLGKLRAAHGDLKASNWIVEPGGRVNLIDMDAFQFALSDSSFQDKRLKDKQRFLRNWEHFPELAVSFRERMGEGL